MKNKIDTSQWRIFKVSDVFGNPTRPKARSIKQYELGDIPFVASGNFNNGIELYVEPKVDEQLDKGGCISISPVGGFAFFQETDFLGRGGAGSSILLLYHKNLNRFNALFLCSILSKSCERYGYGDMCSAEKLKSELLLLPADSLGQPDWAYMENYIKQVIAKQNKHLELLLLSTPSNCKKQLKTKEWSEFLFSDLFSIKKGKRLTKAI
ncbi:restriction endonuclease subunit S [Prevotella corporis]|uniref:restriction endonuclease subunit S n=1 Tax=Prevotella corporis TaxID=28128 RepID=UPI00047239C5|nr:restriction endonuclease subunit S [Prevotella corporis]